MTNQTRPTTGEIIAGKNQLIGELYSKMRLLEIELISMNNKNAELQKEIEIIKKEGGSR